MSRLTVKAGRYQRGLTLIEWTIMLVLGTVLLAAALNTYIGHMGSRRFTQGLHNMQENGHYGVSVLQRAIRLAGYSPDEAIEPLDMVSSGNSTVVIRSREMSDCNGADTTPTSGLAINTYRHDAAENTLTCEGNQAGATPVALVDHVDAFRVLYGVDDDEDDTTQMPQRYIPYDESINAADVVAMRFALLVSSSEPIRAEPEEATYIMLNDSVTLGDRYTHEVYSSTVKLRNQR